MEEAPADKEGVLALWQNLCQSIQSLEPSELAKLVRSSEDFRPLAYNAEDFRCSFDSVMSLAECGDKKAAELLLNCALRIAKFLEPKSLAEGLSESTTERGRKNESTVESGGDFEDVTKNLRALGQFNSSKLGEILGEQFEKLSDPHGWFFDDLDIDFEKKDSSEFLQLCWQRLAAGRLQSCGLEVVSILRRNSTRWPRIESSLPWVERPPKLEDLGQDLPWKNKVTGKGGNRPVGREDSMSDLTIKFYGQLLFHRDRIRETWGPPHFEEKVVNLVQIVDRKQLFANGRLGNSLEYQFFKSDSTKDKLFERLRSGPFEELLDAILESKGGDNDGDSDSDGPLLVLVSRWMALESWERMAALLPDLSHNTATIWADVAMKFLRAKWGGDLNEFSWPQEVRNRAAQKVNQSLEASAKELFGRCLSKLVKL